MWPTPSLRNWITGSCIRRILRKEENRQQKPESCSSYQNLIFRIVNRMYTNPTGVEHREHTDNLLTHSCSPPSSCPGLHIRGCNTFVPIHTDVGRKTPCRIPGRFLTSLFSSFPASGGCCSTVTGIPVNRTSLVVPYGLSRLLFRTEGRTKTPCP